MARPFDYKTQGVGPEQGGLTERGVDERIRIDAYRNLQDNLRSAEEARRANKIGSQIGLPGVTVGADLFGYEREAENKSIADVITGDPAIASFAANSSNAAAIKDDLPALSEMSAIFKLGDTGEPGTQQFTNYMKRLQNKSLLNAYNITPPTARYSSLHNLPARDYKNVVDMPTTEAGRKVGALEGGYWTALSAIGSADRGVQEYLADTFGYSDVLHSSERFQKFSAGVQRAEQLASAPSQQMGDRGNWFGARAYEAAQSIELMGMALLTKKPVLSMAAQTGLQQYGDVRARGATANEALASGLVTGGAEGFFEKYFGLGWMLGNFGKKATGKFVGGLLLREVPSEMATTAVQDAADAFVTGGGGWEGYKARIGEDLLNTAASTALMVGVLGGGHHIATKLRPQAQTMKEIEQAGAEGQFLDQLAAVAETSKVKKEDPGTLRDFIEQRVENTPLRSVYVPVEKAVQYMQSDEYKGELDRYQPQIEEAQATQGDVVIPMGDAVAHLAGTKAWEALKEDMRVSPGGLSRNEARDKHGEIMRVLEQRGKEIAQEAGDTNATVSDASQVYEEVKNRLRSSGIDEKQADAVAQLYAARYEARASRMGGTAMEQYRKAGLVLPGESAEQSGRQFAQEPDTVVNIGLDVPGGGSITPERAAEVLSAHGVHITAQEVRQSASEPTLIARLNRALTPEEGHSVSTALGQEAIAQRSGAEGALFGPSAEKWGPFNPAFFLEPGRALNQSAAVGGYEGLSLFLTDEEKDGLRQASKDKIMAIATSLPDAKEMAAVALAGRAKRGWYENSAQAILDVFGMADAPRFAALLAALSPQTSVEANLINALQTWTNWNNAGRPTDRKAIVQIMGKSVQGGKGVGSILNSWINNSVTALTHENPAQIKLSGPKVDSFMNNLVGVVDEVTNDTWMANYAAVQPELFKKTGQNKGPGYKAMNAVVRAAADILSKQTGEAWTPAEVQETVWSFAKTLYERRDVAGEDKTMRQLLEAGHVTHDDIANTPDFAVLFADGIYRTILEKAGYSTDALGRNRRAVGVDGQQGIGTPPEAAGFSEDDYRTFLGQAADRLESVRNRRLEESVSRRADPRQRTLFQDVLPEAGWTTERIGGLIDAYGHEDGSSSAVATIMSPDEYLGMMASEEGRGLIAERVAGMAEYGPLDLQLLRNSPPIVLRVKLAAEPSKWQVENGVAPSPQVAGHDGRHRMMMLKNAGITRVPVVVQIADTNGASARIKDVTDIDNITPNRSRSDQVSNGDLIGAIRGGVPISWKFREKVEEVSSRALHQSPTAPVFFSALERAIQNSPQNKATGEQWAATLRKTPGVKQEELEWSGITDFLESTTGPITREQLAELMAEGGIEVEEHMLVSEVDRAALLAPYGYTEADLADPEHEGHLIVEDPELSARYTSWSSDPSNPTYRELLLILPPGLRGNPDRAPATHWDTEGVVAHTRFMDKTDADGKKVMFVEEVQSDWHQKGRDQGYMAPPSKEDVQASIERLEEARAKWNEAQDEFIDAVEEMRAEAASRGGKESQSREGAFKHTDDLTRATANIAADNFMQEIGEEADPTLYHKAFELWEIADRAFLPVREAEQDRINLSNYDGIPEAPFKTSWPALVMKRIIRYAAENGYDRVAWTTGEEQAARYNLSQAVGNLQVWQAAPLAGIEQFAVDIENNSARGAIQSQFSIGRERGSGHLLLTEEQMTEVFGADLGKRMMNAARSNPTERSNFGGNDLRVGGEGMKAFYDRNLVNITNDIIKKYGAKVGPVTIPKDASDVSPRMREVYDMSEPATNPGFEITDKMREAALAGLPLFQNQGEGPRGRTTITPDGQKIIELFGTADRSTLLHETGHVWLEELKADNTDDWVIVKDWFAKNGHAVGKDGFIPTEAHELFARGFERYLMEGKSPSAKLRSAFQSFKAWLLRIYGVVQNLQSPITPEIRDVFDRLIATDEAIADARNMNATEPLFKTAEEAGMTDAEFADYQSRVSDARDEAYDALLYKTMEKIRRERTAERRRARSAVRDEVAQEVNAQPQFRLLHLLRTGRWLGEPDREPMRVKLNSGWLIDNFGADVLDKLPRGIQIYSATGEDGDTIAEMVGMNSGTEVVHSLVGMRAASDQLRATGETRSLRDKMIENQTDSRMADRYGDPLQDGTIEEEAIAAINTARQGEIIAAEARQLAKRKSVVGVPTPYEFAREWAKRTVAAGHVRDVASRSALQRYIRAANKAARAAEEAILAGDVNEAYRQKQAQLLNHALLAEAKAAADRIDKIVARMQKLGKRAAMKSVDPEYLEKVHMLLERYDFRPRTQRSIEEQQEFQDWAEKQRARGFEVHIPPRLENRGDPYTRVSVSELDQLNDVVESLIALGRSKQKLKVAAAERDFAEFRDDVVSRLEKLADRPAKRQRWWAKGKLVNASPINEEERKLASAASELLKVEVIIEEMDGGKTGPLHDAIVVGSTNAENKRFALRERVLKPIAEVYNKLGRKQWARMQERITIPELTWNTLNEGDPRTGQTVTLTRMELISVLMNMGNLSNLEKLSKGERWPVPTLHAVVNRELSKEDFDFAQKLWDQVETLWPDIVATEGKMAGVVPEKVVNNPIVTPHGTYRGGYWPVVYDAARWQRAEDLEGKEIDDMFGLKSGVATQKGHTISRTGAFGPINLSIENVLFRHIEQVVTRIAFADYARDVLKIVRDRSIRGMMDTKVGPEYRKQIEKWLARQVHEGAVYSKAARWWDHLLKQLRINMTIAAMGLRFSTGVAQTLGLTASADRIGAKWVGLGLKRVAAGMRGTHNVEAQFAFARSAELLHRAEAVNREIAELSMKMRHKHSWWTGMQHWAMWHIGLIDRYVVALPTWIGAHAKAMSEGMTDEEASAQADKEVRLSQGAGREKDLSAFQSPNSEAMRFFSMFYTPWNVLFNAQWQAARDLRRGDPRRAMSVTFWWMICSTLGDALLSGDWPDDDEEGYLKWFGRNVFFGLWGGIPLVRDFANASERKLAGQYSDYSQTPVTRVYDAVDKSVKMGKQAYKGEDIKHPIKTTGDLSATLLGIPTSQPGATGQFLWDVHEGKSDPKSVSDWYFGLTKGKVPDDAAHEPEESKL